MIVRSSVWLIPPIIFKTLKKNEIIANAHEIDTILGDMHSANTRMASSQSSGSNCVAASSPTELKHGARSVAASSPTTLSHRSRSVAASSPTEVSGGSKPVAASSPQESPKVTDQSTLWLLATKVRGI